MEKKCKYCAMMIPGKAWICPHCRKNQGPGLLVKSLAGLFLLVVFAVFLNSFFLSRREETDRNPETISTGAQNQQLEQRAIQIYQRSEKETIVLSWLVQDDLESYLAGGKSSRTIARFISPSPIRVSGDTLQADYERNEVAADKDYRNRDMFVSGFVLSINRGIGENYYLELSGGSNMFMHPRADMADGLTDYLAAVQRGQKVNLFCKCDGMVMGSVVLRKCIPASIWVEQETEKLLSAIDKKIAEGDESVYLPLSIMAVAITSMLPESSSCFLPGTSAVASNRVSLMKECLSEITNVMANRALRREAVEQAANKYGKDATKLFKDTLLKDQNAGEAPNEPAEGPNNK
jgi:hypothetical protein